MTRRYDTGDCWTTSVLARTSPAFRCFDDKHEIWDPCFLRPGTGAPPAVACPIDFTSVVLITLPHRPVTGSVPPGTGSYWMLQLADGSTCNAYTGAGPAPIDGLGNTATCNNGTVFVWGTPDKRHNVWTIKTSKSMHGPLVDSPIAIAAR